MNKTQYLGINTDRGPSPALWGDCPFDDILSDLNVGYGFSDDFMSYGKTVPTTEGTFGVYKAFTSTGGRLADTVGGLGGQLGIDSDGDDEGASIQCGSAPFRISNSDKALWFEARVKISSIANTKADMFVGLMELAALTATVPITATTGTTGSGQAAMADQNLVGWLHPGGAITANGGSTGSPIYKANGVTAVAVQAAPATFVADTFIKLGMKWEPKADGSAGILSFWVNGAKQTTTYTMATAAGTDFPNDVYLSPVFAILNTAASVTTGTIDWWRCVQLAA